MFFISQIKNDQSKTLQDFSWKPLKKQDESFEEKEIDSETQENNEKDFLKSISEVFKMKNSC